MSKLHVYINPFDDNGNYTGFQEVTRDAVLIGQIKQQLDQTEYDIGIFRNASVSLRMQNSEGKYSDVNENITTIFRDKRGNSKVKITWEPGNDPLICGFFKSGEAVLSEEITLFEGLLNDDATKTDLDVQNVDFKVLGYDSILSEILVPFSILGTETFTSLISAMLNQTKLTDLVSIGSISVGQDVTLNTIASLEGKTVRNVLRQALFASNSVLHIKDNVVIVSPRDANLTPDPTFQFFGEAADFGIENVIDIKGFRSGLNRTFNFWRWRDTTIIAQDSSSTQRLGIREKEIDNSLVTGTTERQSLLDSNRDEFSIEHREFMITTYITPDALVPFLNDRISVDYPALGVDEAGQKTAVYGRAEGYEVDYYATDLFPIQILAAERWKILSRNIDPKNDTITFGVREIIS